jgi:nucleoside-diphosphate-sugar epimerase
MIQISGYTGFIGQHLSIMLGNAAMGVNLRVSDEVLLGSDDALVHLAGKAHDVKKVLAAEEYFVVNTALTKKLFDQFLASEGSVFVFMSSIKALEGIDVKASAYSQSKYMAEQYILSKEIPEGKRVYILRPVMVHGPGNKGNLNLLFGVVKKGFPWPLAAFENQRSFVSVENLCFVIREFILNKDIPSGTYEVADSEAFSTNELVRMAGDALGKKVVFWRLPKGLVRFGAAVGSMLGLPLNTERLDKLTENAVVDSGPLLKVLGKSLPLTARAGFEKTFKSFVHHDQ